jgi:hypothetical protein
VKTFTASAAAQTFTITPTAVGPVTLTPTNSGTLTDPSPALSYATPPAAPTIGTATPGVHSASVAFTPPSTGGSAITGYTATCSTFTNTGGTSPIVVSGLTNGTSYTCTVKATNAVGDSPASASSNSVTPAPATTLTATPATLTFATSYVKGSGAGGAPVVVSSAISDSNVVSTDSFTVASLAGTPWLACVTGTGSVGGSSNLTDTLTCHVVTTQADLLNAGVQTATVHLQVAGVLDVLVTVNLTITAATSPLTSVPSAVTLTYLIGGTNPQSSATRAATITSTDSAWDNYTVTAGFPNWLTVTPTNSRAKSGTNDTLTFA